MAALDCLLELADSQITYRLRYVMVAARAPVIDLVALDPNNPRSVVYQLARIETHLATLPKRGDDSRLSPPEQVATALSTRLRTTDANAIDEAMLRRDRGRTDAAVRRHRLDLFHVARTLRERPRIARMIYDVRQSTTYHYGVAGGACASRAAADADRPRRPARACRRARTSIPMPLERREGSDFFGNRITIDRCSTSRTTC